jgi:hypothetical protein
MEPDATQEFVSLASAPIDRQLWCDEDCGARKFISEQVQNIGADAKNTLNRNPAATMMHLTLSKEIDKEK